MAVLYIMVSYQMVEYDSTIHYGQLLDGRVWQYYTLWTVTRWYSMAVLYIMVRYQTVEYDSTIHYGQLLDGRVWQYYTLWSDTRW